MSINITDIAELKEHISYLEKNINDIFIITNSIIICLMQAGFACIEAGAVRTKNTTNIIFQNVLDLFLSALSYWLFGYPLAFGEGNSVFGYTYWAGAGLREDLMADWLFQFVFAATAATIVSGSVAERSTFVTYITYSIAITGFIYPVASRWTWAENGWLRGVGFHDFSGCGPVHMVAGVMSFVAAALTGPRIGRFPNKNDDAPVEEIVGHSIPLVGIGGLLIVVGFLSFNSGTYASVTKPGDSGVIARIAINSLLGGSGAAIFSLVGCRLGLFGTPAWNFTMTFNATLGGLVCTCAAADIYALWGSFLAGLTCAPCVIALHFIMLRLRIDDPLDSVAIHFGGGMWGLLAACLFSPSGFVYGMSKKSLLFLAYTLFGALVLFLWAFICAGIIFGTLKYFKILRVTPEEELEGLDISLHKEEGYPLKAWENFTVNYMHSTQRISIKSRMLATPGKKSLVHIGELQPPGRIATPSVNSLSEYLSRSAYERQERGVLINVPLTTGL